MVDADTVGGFTYTLAAAPVNVPADPSLSDLQRNHILTVPLSQRQPEVTRELEELDRNLHLAAVAFWAATHGQVDPDAPPAWQSIAIGVATIAGVVAAGKWLLDPFFALLARVGAREVMTAAALLVVLGAALIMQAGGLSMAMGAFLAGVLLSESTFRHELEADIEPFRGILLGLFFLSVGMSLDLAVVAADWQLVLAGVAAFMATKALGIYVVARSFGSPHREAAHRAALFAQGGEGGQPRAAVQRQGARPGQVFGA